MAVTPVKYTGDFNIKTTDYHEIVYTGRTKSGAAVKITLHNAINLSNIGLGFKEKDDVVPEVEWQGAYENTDTMEAPTSEPWEIECSDNTITGANSIVVGAGTVTIDGKLVVLTRGGGEFNVERVYREQNADGDKGAVKGRITVDESRPKLKLSMLTWLGQMDSMFPAVTKA